MEDKNPFSARLIFPLIEEKKLLFARDFCLVLAFSALTALSSKLKIEIGAVPVTMQTLAVLLSGAFLGSRLGAFSQIAYLFLGLAGMPWFSRGGGFAYVFSPTFGYVLGFIISAWIMGFLVEKGWNKGFLKMLFAFLIADLAIYPLGIVWLSGFIGLGKAFLSGFYPFILADLLKITAGIFVFYSFGKKSLNIKNN